LDIKKEIEAHWDKNGDTIKFKDRESASYDVIRGSLTRYAYGRLKDWQKAEDAVQDTYVYALTYPPKGEGHNFGGLFKLWLDQAIVDIKRLDHKKSLIEEEDDEEESMVDNTESDELLPEQAIDISGQVDLIMDMTSRLKRKPKSIIRLALVFGYSYKEVAAIMRVSEATVNNTLQFFRGKVRSHKEYEDLRL